MNTPHADRYASGQFALLNDLAEDGNGDTVIITSVDVIEWPTDHVQIQHVSGQQEIVKTNTLTLIQRDK